MYPSWLIESIVYASSAHAQSCVRTAPPGSFCFVAKYCAATDYRGMPVSREFAMHQTRGNAYLADAMMTQRDSDLIGLLLVKPDGGVYALKVPTAQLSPHASLEAFCKDFSEKMPWPIDPAKMFRFGKRRPAGVA